MKIFISADIEGCGGVTFKEETRISEAVYKAAAQQMTREVVAACESAIAAGATEIVVKDGHGNGGNIDIAQLPEAVTLIRGRSGHPTNMMFGLDSSFDGVMYIGYHGGAGNPASPLSHTSTGASNIIMLNGKAMSEFVMNSYTAAMYDVPVIFISGDEAICREAEYVIPNIKTVATKKGFGEACICTNPKTIIESIKSQVAKAIEDNKSSNKTACKLELPEEFVYEVNYKDMAKAFRMSFYPNVVQLSPRINSLRAKSWMEVLIAHSFMVY